MTMCNVYLCATLMFPPELFSCDQVAVYCFENHLGAKVTHLVNILKTTTTTTTTNTITTTTTKIITSATIILTSSLVLLLSAR